MLGVPRSKGDGELKETPKKTIAHFPLARKEKSIGMQQLNRSQQPGYKAQNV